jgi:hypothetical protein
LITGVKFFQAKLLAGLYNSLVNGLDMEDERLEEGELGGAEVAAKTFADRLVGSLLMTLQVAEL